jgi:hypothetical protein
MHFRVVFASRAVFAAMRLHTRICTTGYIQRTPHTSYAGCLPRHARNPIALQAIYAEGKEHALAVGITRMSTDDMCVSCAPARLPPNPSHAALSARFSVATGRTGVFRFGPMPLCRTGFGLAHCSCYACHRKKINKGIGVETIHYLNDGLWKAKAKFD